MDLLREPTKTDHFEAFVTIKNAAEHLGLPYFKLQRAVKTGLVPSYQLGNARRLVRISEIVAIIERSNQEDDR